MEIRPLTLSDAPRWYAIRVRMLRDHPEAFGSDVDDVEAKGIAGVEERIRNHGGPDSRMFGAFDGEELVGTIAYYFEGPKKRRHVRILWGMYVSPEVRGGGVGRALVERVLAEVAALPGVERIALEVSASNTAARRLYEATGFESYGVEPDGLRIGDCCEDTVLMSRRLAD